MCVRTRESAFSWCLKKSSMMHDDHSHWQPDWCNVTVAVSVNDRIDCHLKHHSFRCKSKVHFYTIVLNSSKTSTCCSNVRITLLLPIAKKIETNDINSSKYAIEIIETMFIPHCPPEVTACISTRKCVVRFFVSMSWISVPCHEGPPATRGHFRSEPEVAACGRYYCS